LSQGKLIGELEHRGDEIGEDDKDRITALHDLNNPELPSPRVREATTEPDGSYYSYEAAKAGKYAPLKCCSTSVRLRGTISKKAIIFILAVVKT
jgi:hypothetical protein